MEQAARHDSYLGFLAGAVRRHVILVAVIVLVGIAGSVAYIKVTPARYTASASLLPLPLLGNPVAPEIASANSTQQTVAYQTEASLVDTSAVADRASDLLGTTVPRPQDVLTATIPPSTQIIKITYTSSSPQRAQEGARAFAHAFLAYRKSVTVSINEQTLTSLEKQLEIANDGLRAANGLAHPTAASKSRAAHLQDQVDSFDARIAALESLDPDPGVVVRSAHLPKAPDGLSSYVIVLVGAVLAFLLGLVLAGVRERRRDLVDSGMEHDVAGLPFLASLPQAGAEVRLITDSQPDDALSEAYRRMRAGFIAVSGKLKVIAISGVSREAIVGPVAVNLGISLAHAGFRVTVVATDGGERSSETLLDAKSSPGLAEVLLDRADLSSAVQEIHGIWFLSAGYDTSQARELYAGPAFKSVIKKLNLESDFVIVASTGVSTADAGSVALVCDGVVLAVTRGVTTHADTIAAIESYESLHITCVGAVSLSDAKPASGADGLAASEAPQAVRSNRSAARPSRKPPRHPKPGFGTDG